MSSSLFDRADYPTLREFVYLNQASLGLIGQPAVDAITGFLERVGRHGNTYMSDEDEAGFLDGLRSRRLSCSEATRTGSRSWPAPVSYSVRYLSSSPRPRGQDRCGVYRLPSDNPPLVQLAERGGCRVDFAHDDPDFDLTRELVQLIDEETAVVTVGSVQYATGTVVDVPRLREATEQAGVRLVVDATQEAGTTNRSIGSWEADVVVSSGYKWLGGHGGVAIGVISRELLEALALASASRRASGTGQDQDTLLREATHQGVGSGPSTAGGKGGGRWLPTSVW